MELGAPDMKMMGKSSEYAPAMALIALKPPTVYVTTIAATPFLRAQPSAAYLWSEMCEYFDGKKYNMIGWNLSVVQDVWSANPRTRLTPH